MTRLVVRRTTRTLKPRKRATPRRTLLIRPPRTMPRKARRQKVARSQMPKRRKRRRRKTRRPRRKRKPRVKKRRKKKRKRKRRKVVIRRKAGIKVERRKKAATRKPKEPRTSFPLNSLVWLRSQTGWHSEWPDNCNKFDQA